MMNLNSRGTVAFFKIYVVVAMVIAAITSPLAMSFVPLLLFVWYVVVWRWLANAVLNLLTECFMLLAIALLLTPSFGPFLSLLISLPALFLVNHGLEKAARYAEFRDTAYARRPTDICLTLLLITIVGMFVAWLVGSLSLFLASAIISLYLGILVAVVLRRPAKPVAEEEVQQRIVAGAEGHLVIKLKPRMKTGGLLFVKSPYAWLKVSPNVLSLQESEPAVKVSFSPPLSGPSIVKLRGKATDRWGLIQNSFELAPIRLYVIPRARYAAWLAKRYLAWTKPGAIPLMSSTEVQKTTYGLRGGIEYYGNQLYQPGDSLKDIDWKHSLKYNELITREFAGFHGRPAVILINLAISSAEEADKLAYNIIVTALSLAQEDIPAALAAYNHEGVKITTPALQPRQLVLQSLQVAQEMVTFINPVKYLKPPDVARLRANMSRIRLIEGKAAGVLAQLLQLEYHSLCHNIRLHPATKALTEVFGKTDKQSNIVIISHRNHDAEALAFQTSSFTQRGHAVINV
jgi:uncharacterized protein (DUF58 family)